MGWMGSDPEIARYAKEQEEKRAAQRIREKIDKAKQEEAKREEERRRKSSWN